MARESQLWTWLSAARLELRERVDLRRVEDSIGAGFPDVDGFFRAEVVKIGAHGFVTDERTIPFGFKLELKSKERPKNPSTPIRFPLDKRVAQIEFMRKRYDMGEAAYFFLQVGSAADAMRYLAPGNAGKRLRAGLTESELAILCTTENGMIFDRKTNAAKIIERIHLCYSRRELP